MSKMKKTFISMLVMVSLVLSSIPVHAAGASGSGTHGSWDYDYNCSTTTKSCVGYMNVYPAMQCRVNAAIWVNASKYGYSEGVVGTGRAEGGGYVDGTYRIYRVDFEFYFGPNALLVSRRIVP